jgi:hypothetical protein
VPNVVISQRQSCDASQWTRYHLKVILAIKRVSAILTYIHFTTQIKRKPYESYKYLG